MKLKSTELIYWSGSVNNPSDPRHPNKVLRYKPPATENTPALEDPPLDPMNLLGMIFSMGGLMLKLKWCAWIAVYCSFISFAHSRSSGDPKQMMSSFTLSIPAVGMSYLQNPQSMTPLWWTPSPHSSARTSGPKGFYYCFLGQKKGKTRNWFIPHFYVHLPASDPSLVPQIILHLSGSLSYYLSFLLGQGPSQLAETGH
ncbi:PAT complex subunit Asterix-like [Dromiciops gliroides]|uniref:PAT complex subunit Asterix-like n=1 Tax=Dromiciops gliroides TaxID=33562 RepID=UPI001CC692E6|nr:PAT complex subunit Asterix-like [Dromiciops gliroides]